MSSMRLHSRTAVYSLLVAFGGLLLWGCGGEGESPSVPTGRYTAFVRGAMADTLTGVAHYRREDGALTGLELGAENRPGLSIELEPQPPGLRTYQIVEAELFELQRPESPPSAMAFLSLRGAQFGTTGGTLELTYVDDDQIGGTFTFQMNGHFGEGASDLPSIEVTGSLSASPQ